MASGIKITKADYGVGANIADVTAAVAARLSNGELNLLVGKDLLGSNSDPAPNQKKRLTVSYTVNDGPTMTKSGEDGSLINIRAPAQSTESGLEIVKAEYGTGSKMNDVTDALKSKIRDGVIDLTVGYKEVGLQENPAPNEQKQLVVKYKLNGAENTETIKDGSKFYVAAPAINNILAGPSIGEITVDFVKWFFLYSLYFIGIQSAYKYGQIFSPGAGYVCGAISLIPGVGFWAICIFAMLFQFYKCAKTDVFQNVINPFTATASIVT